MCDGQCEAVPRVTQVTHKYHSDGACEGPLKADGRWQKIGGLFRKRVRPGAGYYWAKVRGNATTGVSKVSKVC